MRKMLISTLTLYSLILVSIIATQRVLYSVKHTIKFDMHYPYKTCFLNNYS